jgi:predicted dehydrogenase
MSDADEGRERVSEELRTTDAFLRAAIVGCGPRGTGHARAYQSVDSCSLVACCDLDESAARSFAAEYQIPMWFTSVEDMMRESRPDIVNVVTPPAARWSVVEATLPYRPRVVVVEKPLGLRPDEGYRIIDWTRAAGVPLFVNHQMRFFAPLERLRDVIGSGTLGSVRFVRATSRWSLLEHGTHLFDLVSFLFNDELRFERVFTQTQGVEERSGLPDAPSYAAGVVACSDGIRLYFECGPEAPTWPGSDSAWHQFGIEVVGTKGTAGCSLNRGWWCRTTDNQDQEEFVLDEESDEAQVRLLDRVVAALYDPSGHPNNAEKSTLSFDLVMAAQLASLRRDWVNVEERVRDEEIDLLRRMQTSGPFSLPSA